MRDTLRSPGGSDAPGTPVAAGHGAALTPAIPPADAASEAFLEGLVAEDRRMASLHLRLGALSLARAELEDLNRRADIDLAGLAQLAEARWRGGDLQAAAEAATAHLTAGGSRPITRVIAAEAAAAAGHPVEARVHVDALGAVDADVLEHLFSGMPRRAFWPSAPNAPVDLESVADPVGLPVPPTTTGHFAAARAEAESAAAEAEMVGLWDTDEPAFVDRAAERARRAVRQPAEPAEELARAREELGSGIAGEVTRGLARLALVLRHDPTLAPAILDALGPRREVGALLLRGDALRITGRRLDAEAAYAAAGRILDGPDATPRA
jgi:hypothetical protein